MTAQPEKLERVIAPTVPAYVLVNVERRADNYLMGFRVPTESNAAAGHAVRVSSAQYPASDWRFVAFHGCTRLGRDGLPTDPELDTRHGRETAGYDGVPA